MNKCKSMDSAPKDKWILVFDAYIGRWVVAQCMTAVEDGTINWVFARRLSVENPVAFICTKPVAWLPEPEHPIEEPQGGDTATAPTNTAA